MSELRFPILGTEIPPLLGRAKIMDELWSALTKKTPSHRSLVGAQFSGKSVILKALENRMCKDDSPYDTVIQWDLGHHTPQSDDEFLEMLCRQLGEGLRIAGSEYGDLLLQVEEKEYEQICEVIDVLNDEDQKILMLWDGFDKPLSGGRLTRNLWDNLLDLCRKPSFRLVISTCEELHDLIRDEDSVTSDLWSVFEVVRVGVYDDEDIEKVLSTLKPFKFVPGAITELKNSSGKYPPLLMGVLNQLVLQHDGGHIDNKMVLEAAAIAEGVVSPILSRLWERCPAGAQDLYIQLVEKKELALIETQRNERIALIEKGFAVQSGNKLLPSCRMLDSHLAEKRADTGSMARLFGTWENYSNNIRSLLERRLSYIPVFDERLHRLITMAIGDILEYPDDCLQNLTGIEERALDIIWDREFCGNNSIPNSIISYWTQVPRCDDRTIKQRMDRDNWAVSSDRLQQLLLLERLTGSRSDFESRAKFTSKDTYVLINSIHSYRNRSQHREGQTIHIGVAVVAVMTCIELFDCLSREQNDTIRSF
jgi:hypothetical protein